MYTIEEVMAMARQAGVSYGVMVSLLSCERTCAREIKPKSPVKKRQKSGGIFKKAVVVVDRKGQKLEEYSSIVEAAKAEGVSYATVADSCIGMLKNQFSKRSRGFRFKSDVDEEEVTY